MTSLISSKQPFASSRSRTTSKAIDGLFLMPKLSKPLLMRLYPSQTFTEPELEMVSKRSQKWEASTSDVTPSGRSV